MVCWLKQIRMVLLVAVLLVSTASSVGSAVAATQAAPPNEIVFWEWFGGTMGDFFEDEARLFSEAHPGLTVRVEHYPDQRVYNEILGLAFASGSAPDVFVRSGSYLQLIIDGWIQPLDQWISDEWLARFPESARGSFVDGINAWAGEIYTFPTYASTYDSVLYVNERLFRSAGLVDLAGQVIVPSTWSDLRDMASVITEAGDGEYYGFGMGIKEPGDMAWWFTLSGLAGTPGLMMDWREGRYTYGTDPGYAEVVELFLGMKQDGSIYPYEGTLDSTNRHFFFGQGKFAMFASGTWAISELSSRFPEFDEYQVVSLPVPDDGRKGGLGIVPGGGTGLYFMSSQAEQPGNAWLWLEWISSRAFHKRMVSAGMNFSIYTDLNTRENIPTARMAQAYEAITGYATIIPFPASLNPMTLLVRPETSAPDIGELLAGIYTGQVPQWQEALLDLEMRKQTAFEAAIEQAQERGEVSVDDFVFADWNPMEDYLNRPEE